MDRILGGGYPRNGIYLIQGTPGTGKTTLGLQFLLEGIRHGERALYITLSWSKEEIEDIVRSHNWSLEGLEVHEHPVGERFNIETRQTIFHPGEIELNETMAALFDVIDRARADRIVVDSLLELRLLAADPLQYRRQVFLLRQHFADRHATAVLLDDLESSDDPGIDMPVHGVVTLGRQITRSGGSRRWLRVERMRGMPFSEGNHDASIVTGGLCVYPRHVAAAPSRAQHLEPVSSGIEELDRLMGGGLDRDSSALLVGPSGVGKSTLAVQYALAAAIRGERAALYLFGESPENLVRHSSALGMGLADHVAAGRIQAYRVDPASLSPGEFAYRVREAVEHDGVRLVVIDGLTDYPDFAPARFWIPALHGLLNYLSQQDVFALLVAAQGGVSPGAARNIDLCPLADTVLQFRYYERAGATGQSVSVLKRRGGNHERTIHDLQLGKPDGIHIGPALTPP